MPPMPRFFVPSVFSPIINFRLGYTQQTPYPWRWTTPVALVFMSICAVFLTLLNIPLAAYETTQELTYFPNSTLAPLPMSNFVPSFLQSTPALFGPQNLNVGDNIRFNNSIFIYTLTNAVDTPNGTDIVSSFPYFNSPFSLSCDVVGF
ncbi:hypothetical protein HMN09_00382600 [Mycena chlorophos]|uniref:Uncharacterized protein n=1 Tax=Mycena chlorophos TaxID=658473 RepID=A0A8H6WL46_MYCCL|nr:hypothetical protein HMN09_00382600 [Mycena chlorophos]